MKRRTFLTALAATPLLARAAHAGAGFTDYKPGLIQAELDAGKTVFVDYAANWCGTCRAQKRIIKALRAENPAYDTAMSFVRVDWDDYGRAEVTTSRSIPRRSTLIVLRGEKELGRIVAGTSKDQIAALMDLGLAKS